MLIEQGRSDQNAIIALKDAMVQDMIEVARTSRDRNEIHNIAEIYGGAIRELQDFDPSRLPAEQPTNDWSAHFYDSAKDCSDDDIRVIWSKILAGEIKSPGSYYKRTLTNLKQMERHEAEWFVKLCKYVIEDSYVPEFVLNKDIFPFNEYQSLVDCGFLNANHGSMEIKFDSMLPLRNKELHIKIKDRSYHMNVIILTDTGIQISRLVNVEADTIFAEKLVEQINKSEVAVATIK